jgi:hypothetical protein
VKVDWEQALRGAVSTKIKCVSHVCCEKCNGTQHVIAVEVPGEPFIYFLCEGCSVKAGIMW